MFKQLRNKFLLLNLVIISVMMLIAFTSIYFITSNAVQKDIDMELYKISKSKQKTISNLMSNQPDPDASQHSFDLDAEDPSHETSFSFALLMDRTGSITPFSHYDLGEEFYNSAMNAALSRHSDKGKFKLDDDCWAFVMQPFQDGRVVIFLEITKQEYILTQLIYTFILVAMVMLIIIYLISKFFANKSIKPIKEAFDKQKQFITDASHELKTPLTVINTNVDVLLANSDDHINEHSKWLHYIKTEVERMTHLTNDLLYLTQMDYSEAKVIFSNFNFSETLENVVLTMEAVSFENNISLSYDIEPGLTVYGNSEQIREVIMILLDNALKYTNPRGTVDVTLKKIHNTVILIVTNSGEGITKEHIDKIFDRFYRSDQSRSRAGGGYGLGLAIAKTILEHHGGKISVKSVLNERTSFTVELPLSAEHFPH
ncbi:His Kinase A (phospho-acceptor) domain-containing protein [Paenibacillus sophorae]|uniref:histidine kinase n=1 Tax=Paenibacillus sophorae TaxID=1333845 RepID=A0A1H8MP35_9BACL|nr:HAMP domain-containing sensor histidine kinase [Paenibacillus sophorae]QWU17887.1 HAMP domain-containing histidine kinase [Paenibacillus sophorae]SEO19013.1 His Kinase A (phospho-acceptor) domain-containing protein [Paenibacillus sophorae]